MIDRTDRHWYKNAVIYELHIKAFLDADNDGIGDFAGLVQKLDYLHELGVTAIWLLPFYPSPFRDDGYDIADYTSIDPTYGTMRDFRQFVEDTDDLREDLSTRVNALTHLFGMGMSADETPLNGRLGPHRRFEWKRLVRMAW